MSTYPGTLDSFTAKVDNVDDVIAADVNTLQAAIVATQTELGTDPAGSATDLKTRLAHSINNAGWLEFDAATELTIASGAIAITQNNHTVDTQGDAATDDLDTINGGTDGLVLFFRSITCSFVKYPMLSLHNEESIYLAISLVKRIFSQIRSEPLVWNRP